MLGVAIGLAIHFWRDTMEGDSGVSLLWPISITRFNTSRRLPGSDGRGRPDRRRALRGGQASN